MRQAMLNHFDKFTGVLGGVLARAGLLFVETNLTGDAIVSIIDRLERANFPASNEVVNVRIRPPNKMNYKVYDFSDEESINKLTKKIESYNKTRYEKNLESPQPSVNVLKKLDEVLLSATPDTTKHPSRVISKLKPYYEQRA